MLDNLTETPTSIQQVSATVGEAAASLLIAIVASPKQDNADDYGNHDYGNGDYD